MYRGNLSSGPSHRNFFPDVEADNKRLMMHPLWNGYMARRGNEKPFLSTIDQGITEIFSGNKFNNALSNKIDPVQSSAPAHAGFKATDGPVSWGSCLE